ncbi:ATP-binding protein [Lentimicrobium sp. S6]|uniref:sensor histidine kinase n=1 Tax=Lentimicrobium sp. S6 TaxID=2735872 RepID=UPI001552C781|nr:ATP-binding protein [Lentimicrobium sp. S6]NPD46152.1 GHKL domain-containing protein [Lentimicrobium sp. S6]
MDIYNDGDSVYWCGAYNGILRRQLISGETVLYGNQIDEGLVYGNILNIYRDFNGQLLAGSDISGLLIFNEELQGFQSFRSKFYPSFDFKTLRINHINQTPDSIYWISTDKGLLKMNNQEIRFITVDDGMPNDFVYATIFDDNNHLWISSNGGICSYQLDNGHVSTFSINDGLQGLEFNTAAHYKSKDGSIYFGGVNGFNYFDPSNIYQEEEEFPVVITGIFFNNNEFKPEYDSLSVLNFSIPPDIEYFKLEFASLNYVSAPQNRYRYKINEIHDSWIDLGREHEIGFHGLDPGTYHLDILASDHHGSWSKAPLKIEFKVDAMFWETFEFKIGLALLILVFIFLGINYRISLLKSQKKKIEELVDQRTKELSSVNQKLRKVNATKEKFLAIISHDIKNPLGAAQSVSADLKENFDEYTEEERNTLLGIMCRSLNHLQDLITNLSSWSKLQHQEIKPRFEDCDLDIIIKENIELVAASLLKKELKIELKNQINSKLYADCKMLDLILRNLISNAIKFSYSQSVIHISAMEDGSNIHLNIQDSGIGMSEEVLAGLFSSERSQSLPGTANEQGTGFGLLMIKEFVKLNKGEISVESKEGEGSVFKMSFPVQTQK